ncbi:MAG: radical SAM protein [Firmicutes bacterium]|nr:radical SAM protein [Bacillota bacterium]
MPLFTPCYIETYKAGLLEERIRQAQLYMESCCLCPRYCRVNRLQGEHGFCRTGQEIRVSGITPHFGEESPISGIRGSGTIFFVMCNLGCVFCQNYDISHLGGGNILSAEELADAMLLLQAKGCHNINFVTPTHVIAGILKALTFAVKKGLRIPLVWNCGGYESPEALALLDGIIDIYMPDFKFWHEEKALRYCYAAGYPQAARNAVKEMHRQTGDLKTDARGIAYRGILIRHLVMPDNAAGTEELVRWLSSELSPDTYINIMDQYRPCFKASQFPEINRKITAKEYADAVEWGKQSGLRID